MVISYSGAHPDPSLRKVCLMEVLAGSRDSVQFRSVTQSCLTLCDPVDCSKPGFPVHHQLPELAQSHVHWVGGAIQPSHPLSSPFLPPSIFPSIRVFSSESVLPIRWPKDWSFSFSISPSSEYSGLISFRMDWFVLHVKFFRRFREQINISKTLRCPEVKSKSV